VKSNYDKYSLPIDALWTDIDYMYKYYDFTIDTERYNISVMNSIYNLSNSLGLHWVPIIDVGIAVDSDAR
jgi:alpha-glucosidase (family GH31 glycosyl hydrolase)